MARLHWLAWLGLSVLATSGCDGRGGPDPGPSDGGALDAAPFPGCDGVLLETDGVLDFDLARAGGPGPTSTVRVNGTVTLDGAPFPASGRGAVVFSGESGSTSAELAASGPALYSVELAPGRYEVLYAAGACVEGGGPCNGGSIRGAMDVRSDGVLDLDVRSARVSGTVTLRGAAFPEGARGAITFEGADGSAAIAIASSGAATYAIRLVAGTYDVGFDGGSIDCASPAGVPCNAATIRPDVALNGDGVLDLDVASVRLRGNVTVRGGPMPDELGDRGRVCFGHGDERGACTASFGASGAASFEIVLVPGDYDALYSANPSLCAGGTPMVPCIDGPAQRVSARADGVFDLDLAPITVSGRVTAAGASLPDELGDRGALVFSTPSGASVRTQSFGSSGEASYAVTVLPGTYAIALAANTGLCEATELPVASPCVDVVFAAAQALSASGVLDFDLRTVAVRGAITLDGAPLPSGAGGAVRFARADAEAATTVSAADGAYAIRVPAGLYDVSYQAGTCSPGTRLPCNGGRVLSGVSLTADGVLDVPLRAARISGRVTLEGATLPDAASERGELRFDTVDGFDGARAPIGPFGEATYELVLLAGRYVVRWDGSSALCGDPSGIPCTTHVLAGCR